MKKYFFYFMLTLILSGCQTNNKVDESSVKKDVVKASVGTNIGNQAPEIQFPNPDGDIISLYSLRGKLVLIDFWASWCPPCRLENPNIVKSYLTYKNKKFINGDGFTIYSISLDNKKEDWIEAIQSDNLTWDYHVSDLKGWSSMAAAMYQVQAIPTNFLIDENGIILARDLRAEQLSEILESLKQ